MITIKYLITSHEKGESMSNNEIANVNKIYEAIRKAYGYDEQAEKLIDMLDVMAYAYEHSKD